MPHFRTVCFSCKLQVRGAQPSSGESWGRHRAASLRPRSADGGPQCGSGSYTLASCGRGDPPINTLPKRKELCPENMIKDKQYLCTTAGNQFTNDSDSTYNGLGSASWHSSEWASESLAGVLALRKAAVLGLQGPLTKPEWGTSPSSSASINSKHDMWYES